MCPACLATAALVAAGATSTGGLAAYAAKKLLPTTATEPTREKKGASNESAEDRIA